MSGRRLSVSITLCGSRPCSMSLAWWWRRTMAMLAKASCSACACCPGALEESPTATSRSTVVPAEIPLAKAQKRARFSTGRSPLFLMSIGPVRRWRNPSGEGICDAIPASPLRKPPWRGACRRRSASGAMIARSPATCRKSNAMLARSRFFQSQTSRQRENTSSQPDCVRRQCESLASTPDSSRLNPQRARPALTTSATCLKYASTSGSSVSS